jgi:hypothetical protein
MQGRLRRFNDRAQMLSAMTHGLRKSLTADLDDMSAMIGWISQLRDDPKREPHTLVDLDALVQAPARALATSAER